MVARLGAFLEVFLGMVQGPVFKGFIHRVTGLPTFAVNVGGVLKADGKFVCKIEHRWQDPWFSPWVFSYVLAPVGEAVGYTLEGADGRTYGPVRLTRTATGCPDGGAEVASQAGRGVFVDLYEDTGDPLRWENQVSEYENGVIRFKRGKLSGSSRFVVDTPERVRQVHDVLEAPGLTLISLGQPAKGVDGVRSVLVKSARYDRLSPEGDRQIDVEWTMQPFPGPKGEWGLDGAVIPSATWGDAIAQGRKWGNWTVLDVMKGVGFVA